VKDVALIYQKIVKQLSHYENGVVADTMHSMGLKYSINLGLSMPQIDQVAKAIKKSNELAFFLWEQKERESKLLALRILENYNLNSDQIDQFITGITNVELAEQAAIQLFIKMDNSIELASKLIGKDKFIQLSGFIVLSKIAMIEKELEDSVFRNFLDELTLHLPNGNAIYLRRGLAQAFLRIGLRNKELKIEVEATIKEITNNDSNLGDYLSQEVSYYLI